MSAASGSIVGPNSKFLPLPLGHHLSWFTPLGIVTNAMRIGASRDVGAPAALAYHGTAFVAPSSPGLALIFSSRPLYSYYEHTPRLWGLSPVRDQNLGGILMNAEQTLVFLLAIGFYVWRLLSEEDAAAAPSRT